MPQAKKDDELETNAKIAALQLCIIAPDTSTSAVKDILKKESKDYIAPYIVKRQSMDKVCYTVHHVPL